MIISITYSIREKIVWVVLTGIVTCPLTPCLTYFLATFCLCFFFSFNFISCKASLFKNNIKINYEIICMYFSFIYLIFLLDETQETLTRTHGVG